MEIRPFVVDVAQAALDDLRDRLARTRWPDLPRGGHFVAVEAPNVLADELRTFFRPFRRPA